MDPGKHVLEKGQDRANSCATARGDTSAMRPFAKLLWTLVILPSVTAEEGNLMGEGIAEKRNGNAGYLFRGPSK